MTLNLQRGFAPFEPQDIDIYPLSPESYLLKTLDCLDLSSYRAKGGYGALKKALTMKPEKDSILQRGCSSRLAGP